MRRIHIRTAITMTMSVMMGGYGCAAESGRPPPAEYGELTLAPADVSETSLRAGPCDAEGETVTCRVETGRAGTIVNCFEGTQTCTDGSWSTCAEASGRK